MREIEETNNGRRGRRARMQAAREAEVKPRIEDTVAEAIVCPLPTDPAMGDKTPSVMRWWAECHPLEYVKKYGTRICGAEVETGREDEGPPRDFEHDDEAAVKMRKPRVLLP